MKVKDFNKIVVVVAVHGERYIGYVNKSDPKKYLNECQKNKEAVILNDVRIMAMRSIPNPGGGVIQNCIAIPPDMLLDGPAKSMRIVPSAWYIPSENSNTEEKVEALFRGAENMEGQARAAQAGILTPKSSSLLPGMPQQ